jgi:hypothetical protein
MLSATVLSAEKKLGGYAIRCAGAIVALLVVLCFATPAARAQVQIIDTLSLNGSTLTVNGNLTISNYANVTDGSTLSVTGDLTNAGNLYTGYNGNSAANTLNVTGAFINQAGANTYISAQNNSADVANVGSLANAGYLQINSGATMNITGGGPGVMDVVAGSMINLYGTLELGGNPLVSGLANLTSIEGYLGLGNAQTAATTPTTGTLNVASGGQLQMGNGSTLTVAGNLTNAGAVGLGGSTLTVNGYLINSGTVSVAAGALLGVGTGTFTATSGYQQLSTGTLTEIIGSDSSYGVLDITGPASLAGTLDVDLINGFDPTSGENFYLLESTGGVSGTFTTLDLPSGEIWNVSYNTDCLTTGCVDLTFEGYAPPPTSTPEPSVFLLLAMGIAVMIILLKYRDTVRRGEE